MLHGNVSHVTPSPYTIGGWAVVTCTYRAGTLHQVTTRWRPSYNWARRLARRLDTRPVR